MTTNTQAPRTVQPRRGKLLYVALQPTRPGQGGYAHVHGILSGLADLGWTCDLVDAEPPVASGRRNAFRRAASWIRVGARAKSRLPNCDVVYVRDHPAALPVMRACRNHGVPTVLEINGGFGELSSQYTSLRALRWLFAWQARARVREASGVVCVTRELADWAQSVGARLEPAVIPNGADTRLFSPDARSDFELPEPYVVFVGSLSPWHGLPTLLESVRRPEWPRSMHLVIAGAGQDQRLVERTAEELPNVTYLGPVPHDRIPGLLAGSSAALSTQTRVAGYTAGSPVKVYESVACGVPTIVSDYLEVAEELEVNGAGISFPADDARGLALRVADLASHPARGAAIGIRARRLALERYDWGRRATTTDEFIARVLENSHASPERGRERQPVDAKGS